MCEHFRGLIVTLAIKPGTSLSTMEVAESLDLFPIPVWNALSRLEKEGVVKISRKI
jgi:DNA-binding GntR family transcriptional regulator